MKNILSFLLLAFIFHACSDNATVNFFDKNIADEEIECLGLVVFPSDVV